MQDINLTENFCILLLEESKTLQALFDDWSGEIATKVVSSPKDIPTVFDETVVAACLSQSALTEQEEEIRKYILKRNPYCQLVVILSRSTFLNIHESDYDATIQRPIFKDEFQQTIADQFARGAYTVLLREFYDLNSKLLCLKQRETPENLSTGADLTKLLERHTQLISQLNSLRKELSSEDIEAISKSIELHKRYLTQPDSDHDTGITTKYHPPRCPACRLPWGVDHRNELGKGLTALGSGVWKCTRCNEIVHGLGEGGRRIMHG